MNKRHPPLPPALVLIIGIMAVSTASVFIRYAQQDAPSLVIAAGRLTVAALVLAPVALLRRRDELAHLTRAQLGLALLSGTLLAIHFATWISSLEYTTVASSVVLVSTTPLWVAILTPILLKEKIQHATVIGMAAALIGGAVVALSDSCAWEAARLVCPDPSTFIKGEAFNGDLLALAGALAAAGYILIGRRLRAGISLISYILVVYSAAAVVLVVWMLSLGLQPFGLPPQTYVWILLLGLVPQLIGHSSFNWALGYLSAAYVAITLLGEPIGSTVLALLLLGETPSGIKILGGVMILIGIVIASRSSSSPA